MNSYLTFLLLHSPLVGAETWQPVADELRRYGYAAVVPELPADRDPVLPCWQADAQAVAAVLRSLSGGVVLVGHSGAGPLLPAVHQLAGRPVAGYIFADAGIPVAGRSRLDLLRLELPEMAAALEEHLRAGGRYPEWSDADVAPLVPDVEARRKLLTGLRPQGLAFFSEPLPVFAGWPDAPCSYLQFSLGYDYSAQQATVAGWPQRNLHANHFHLLNEPAVVATALLELALVQPGKRAK